MRLKPVMHAVAAAGVLFWTAACEPTRTAYLPGPGCLIHLYTLPNLQGSGLPVLQDTQELAAGWHDTVSSARVIYGTWRLFASPDYKGFMGDYKAPVDVMLLAPARELDSLRCIAGEPPPPPPPPPPGY